MKKNQEAPQARRSSSNFPKNHPPIEPTTGPLLWIYATSILRSILCWLIVAVYWSAFILIYGLTLKKLPNRWVTSTIRFWGHLLLWVAGIKLRLDNPSTLEDRRCRVVVVNHQSALDILWGAAIIPEGALAIGKKEVIYIPFLNLLWWLFGFIRIDRSNSKKAHQGLAHVATLLRTEARSLIIAPEGTRAPTSTMLPFKKGAFRIAIEAQASIYPVVVSGAVELWPKSRLLPLPGEIRLRFLTPIPTAGLTLQNLEELMGMVRSEMEAALLSLNKVNAPDATADR